MSQIISNLVLPGSTDSYQFRALKLPATLVGSSNTPVYVNSDGVVTACGTLSSSILPSIPFSKLPSLYWGNVTVASASSTTTLPVVSTVTVLNDASNKCQMLYDSTEKCLKFVF